MVIINSRCFCLNRRQDFTAQSLIENCPALLTLLATCLQLQFSSKFCKIQLKLQLLFLISDRTWRKRSGSSCKEVGSEKRVEREGTTHFECFGREHYILFRFFTRQKRKHSFGWKIMNSSAFVDCLIRDSYTSETWNSESFSQN